MNQFPMFVPRGAHEVPARPLPSVAVDTSQAAAVSMRQPAQAIRAAVLAYIRGQGEQGATCDQVEVALDLRHQTCSPRILELSHDGDVIDTGRRRVTRSRRTAVVWIAREWA